jgi:hypothetical protein
MMKQCSRIQWLAKGDRNTAFFHAKARERARTNRIVSLKTDEGAYVTSQGDLEDLAINFYTGHFAAQDQTNPELITHFIRPRVTPVMN